MPARGSGGIRPAAATARRRHSAAAAGLRDSNTSRLLPGCLRGNKSWRETRASTRLRDSGRAPPRGAVLRFENPFACRQGLPAQPKTADPWGPSEILPRMPLSIRSIFPCARGPAPPGNQVLVIDRPGLGQAWLPRPSARHPRHFVPQSAGLVQRTDSRGTPANRGSIPRLEIGSHGLFGENQQHPIAVWPPFFFEIRALDPEKLAPPRIVDEHGPALPIDAGYHHVV